MSSTVRPMLRGLVSIWLGSVFLTACSLPGTAGFELKSISPPPTPTITNVSPTLGSLGGGETITITGKGFTSDSKAYVAGSLCSSQTFVSDTTLTCQVPPHTTIEKVAIKVETADTWNGGLVSGSLDGQFAYGAVLGQPNLESNANVEHSFDLPYGAASCNGKILMADMSQNRVLIWNSRASVNQKKPDLVLGQANLQTKAANFHNVVDSSGMTQPFYLACDVNGRVFVGESNRVLIWNTFPTRSGQPADLVLGQPDFTTQTSNNGGVSASSLATVRGIYSTGTRLYVADFANHRVLVWNSMPTTNGQAADLVIGQPDFTSNTCNNGGRSETSLCFPHSVSANATQLFISETTNNRVLIYNTIPTANHPAADVVLGQSLFTTNTANNGGISASSISGPQNVYTSGGKLYVADTSNHRVLVWNTIPTSNFAAASFVLGQPDTVSNTAGTSNALMYSPTSVTSDGTSLYVVDANNQRMLQFNTLPTAQSTPADFAFGQPDMTQRIPRNANGGVSASTLRNPTSVSYDGTNLAVVDAQTNRVLLWNGLPTSNGQAANVVVGMPDFVTSSVGAQSASTLNGPIDAIFVGTKMAVADRGNNRVTIYNTIPNTNSPTPDVVFGQAGKTAYTANQGGISAARVNQPSRLATDGTKLFVSDTNNNRILGLNVLPTSDGGSADFVLGQAGFGTSTSLNGGSATGLAAPLHLTIADGALYATETGNGRIVVWPTAPTATNTAPGFVIGQTDLNTIVAPTAALASASRFFVATGVASAGGKLYVGDSARISIFSPVPTANAPAATSFLGQSSPTSLVKNIGGLNGDSIATAASVKIVNGLMFIADGDNNRVVIRPVP